MTTTIASTEAAGHAGNGVLSSRAAKFADNPFLTLLVTQMRQQTPLDPVDNGSFMQQLASFSSMEEQKQINDNLLSLLDFQGLLARLQGLGEGSALLGKEVTWEGADGEQSGVVEAVFIAEDGEVRLRLADARELAMREVTGIRTPKAGAGEG
ncbi:MAG TPA: flagellar hook capping FlgD N-terminal domain-containing protein [Planctomycetota bacterium]|nr:flagellar hook capping FlgD N-terminal domain-containing protein [Planctomycetota bacterium]